MKLATEPVDILELSRSNVIDKGTSEERPFDLAGILGSHVQVEIYDSRPIDVYKRQE